MKKKTVRPSRSFTREDMVHFVIYRELDKLRVLLPYDKATRICNGLKEVVSYRAPKL